MRALTLIPLLVLAACSGENQGWNPNYRANATPYGDYLRGRELALTGQRAEPPRVIPVALPVRAPTPAQIAGPSPVQILEQAVTPNGLPPRQVPFRGAPAVDPRPPVAVVTASTTCAGSETPPGSWGSPSRWRRTRGRPRTPRRCSP